MIRLLQLFFLSISIPCLVQGQEYVWRNITSSQGLMCASVNVFARLQDGRMAFGTHEGLIIYNGVQYTRFVPPNQSGEKINPYVNDLKISHDGSIWVATRNSVWRVNPYTMQYSVFTDSLLSSGGIMQLDILNGRQRIYALHPNRIYTFNLSDTTLHVVQTIPLPYHVYRFNVESPEHFNLYRHQLDIASFDLHQTSKVFRDTGIIDAHFNHKINCWLLLKSNGAYYLDKSTYQTHRLPIDIASMAIDRASAIFSDEAGGFAISTPKGIWCFESIKNLQPEILFSDKNNPYSIPYHSARTLLKEKDGTLWIGGSGAAISTLPGGGYGIKYLPSVSLGVNHFWLFTELYDHFFLGTTEGLIIGKWRNGKFNKIKHLNPLGIQSRFSVTGMQRLDKRYALIGTYNQGLWKYDHENMTLTPFVMPKLFSGGCQGMLRMHNNLILIQGTLGTYIYDSQKHKLQLLKGGNFSNPIAAAEDHTGNIYVGSGYGIDALDSNLKPLATYQHRYGDSTSLSSNIVLSIQETDKQLLYVGTMGNGLCLLNRKTRNFKTIQLAGEPSNIYGILKIKSKTLLLTTSSGIILYDETTGESISINTGNLLPFNDFGQLSWYQNSTHVFAGGESGFVAIEKSKLPALSGITRNIRLRNAAFIHSTITLAASERNLALHLTDLFPNMQSDLSFSYRLKGYETKWHEKRSIKSEITYLQLPPGEYVMEAMISDPNHLFRAKPITLTVTALPYFYETNWFRWIAAVCLLILLIFTIRYLLFMRLRRRLKKLEQEQQLANERHRISRELHDNVGSQLTYLITGLEASGIYLEQNQNEQVAGQISELKSSARESLQQLRDAIWALNKEVMHTGDIATQFNKWLGKITEPHFELKASFTNQVRKEFIADPILALNIFRCMQEAVNNALKHANAQHLEVKWTEIKEGINICIKDDGRGFEKLDDTGVGLTSMRTRVEECKGIFEIESKLGHGTRINIYFPLK